MLWTAAEERYRFYGGHKSSDAAGGAADTEWGKQGPETDGYEVVDPVSYMIITVQIYVWTQGCEEVQSDLIPPNPVGLMVLSRPWDFPSWVLKRHTNMAAPLYLKIII